jgi:hypothetical protein
MAGFLGHGFDPLQGPFLNKTIWKDKETFELMIQDCRPSTIHPSDWLAYIW